MNQSKLPSLLAVDLETTGLVPGQDTILEIAAMALRTSDLTADGLFHVLIDFDVSTMPEAVLEMHTKSGLVEDLRSNREAGTATALKDADRLFNAWMSAHYGPDDKPWLLGRNPAFDRSFMERFMPISAARLHYRSLDVTAFWWLADAAGLKDSPVVQRNHRAGADVDEAVSLAQWWVRFTQTNGQGHE